MTKQDYIRIQQALFNRAEIFRHANQETIGVYLKKNGALLTYRDIDNPDLIETVYVSQNDPQYKHFTCVFE